MHINAPSPPSKSSPYARYVLALLLGVNLLNYIDRQVLYAVFPLIQHDFSLSDTALGLLGSGFMVTYMVSAPLFGWLGDRWSRTRLAAAGLGIWSVATAAAGLAPTYPALLTARTTVGVGEASFGTVSPGLLAEFFDRERRGRILSYFYLAIPVGSALGYLLGGVIGQQWGWHAAFMMVGLPGLLLVLPVWLMREPPRSADAALEQNDNPDNGGYRALFRNRSFIANTLAMAAMTFALGGLAQWIPTFLYREHGLSVSTGNTLFGGLTVVTGICGTLTGGWLGDRLQRRTPKGYLLVSGWGFLLGTPAAAYAILTPSLNHCLGGMFLAEFFLFLNTGPLNTVIVNVTRPAVRAMAFAVNIFFIHALGDAISPTILGRLSDIWGLRTALLSTPVAILVAALFAFVCCHSIEGDMAKAE
ncbi:major facilitator superfamily MFS_1 [Geobacter metallireducens RCH3]|uniref:Membrane protein, major facilitator superfamily n=1 Tax=Geobacter metallireducens (strain ATCC 53774 / DSM 7210 / GS-15) TaxID=269799 RepID=Q39QP0_GEOMG|nr:MFS transporter [Geobacter metallireducens]ABB33434.1 membrane protein, major facilitator superfamily [Geobacter metallireducens GS-15]EHP87487.1 major facilitator superfamily MFS_1 [Geobacter metallireducens RCH3]